MHFYFCTFVYFTPTPKGAKKMDGWMDLFYFHILCAFQITLKLTPWPVLTFQSYNFTQFIVKINNEMCKNMYVTLAFIQNVQSSGSNMTLYRAKFSS